MTSMHTPLLPTWLRAAWVTALIAVVVVHLAHAYRLPGQPRWWHIGHVVMAAGMALMYLPPGMHHGHGSRTGVALFLGVAVATAAATAVLWRREAALNPLWVVLALDMLVMAYMWLPVAARPAGLDVALAAYLGCQVLAWALGLWDRVPVLARSGPAPMAAGTVATAVPRPATGATAMVGLIVHSSPAVRITLAVMVASMGYMLVVM